MKIAPLKGRFEDWRSLLAHVAEHDEIKHLVVVTVDNSGDTNFTHFDMTREEMAFAALLLQRQALAEED